VAEQTADDAARVVAHECTELPFLRVADDCAVEVQQSIADDARVGGARIFLELDAKLGHDVG
jgi:hypothetical protein